jgi:hypothetical protein
MIHNYIIFLNINNYSPIIPFPHSLDVAFISRVSVHPSYPTQKVCSFPVLSKKTVDLRSDSVLKKSLSPLVDSLRNWGYPTLFKGFADPEPPKKIIAYRYYRFPKCWNFPLGKFAPNHLQQIKVKPIPILIIEHLTLGCLFFARDSNHHATDEKHGTHPHLVQKGFSLW